MMFNSGMCHVMHLGVRNKEHEYTMDDQGLDTEESEKDGGVLIHKSLKPSLQCTKAATRDLLPTETRKPFLIFAVFMYGLIWSMQLRVGPPAPCRTRKCLRKYSEEQLR